MFVRRDEVQSLMVIASTDEAEIQTSDSILIDNFGNFVAIIADDERAILEWNFGSGSVSPILKKMKIMENKLLSEFSRLLKLEAEIKELKSSLKSLISTHQQSLDGKDKDSDYYLCDVISGYLS